MLRMSEYVFVLGLLGTVGIVVRVRGTRVHDASQGFVKGSLGFSFWELQV